MTDEERQMIFIENLARAACSAWFSPEDWDKADEVERGDWIAVAKAVLRAMLPELPNGVTKKIIQNVLE